MKLSPLKPQFFKPQFFKLGDIAVIVLAAVLTLGIALRVYSGEAASSRIVVRGQERTWIFPMDAEESLSAAGPIGETRVKISGGRAAIVSSPCSAQTCVAAGELHRSGQWTACLPNMVFILIEGRDDAVDAISW